jgi:glycosyltransferase involved in cell wall biosynthesis
MVSFRDRLSARLVARGVQVYHQPPAGGCDAVLVIGGTRQLSDLWRLRRGGARIVQRLNGMNWLQRRLPTGPRHFLRAEVGNWLLAFIRARLSDRIVYQSQFARGWWERVYGLSQVPHQVIYNGVDLAQYSPEGPQRPPEDRWRVLMVEGSLMGGYEFGLQAAVGLAENLQRRIMDAHSRISPVSIELMVVGRVPPETQARWSQRVQFPLVWAGLQPAGRIPEIDRSAHLLYSADLNAACPNSVIEALACGLPVISFDTGALPELVTDGSGRVVPYGGDPWLIQPPDVPALSRAALEILQDHEAYRQRARQRAEAAFDLDQMVDHYLRVLLDT